MEHLKKLADQYNEVRKERGERIERWAGIRDEVVKHLEKIKDVWNGKYKHMHMYVDNLPHVSVLRFGKEQIGQATEAGAQLCILMNGEGRLIVEVFPFTLLDNPPPVRVGMFYLNRITTEALERLIKEFLQWAAGTSVLYGDADCVRLYSEWGPDNDLSKYGED